MTIMVLGADGYIGWPLLVRLANSKDEDVVGVDNLVSRQLVAEVGGTSALPISTVEKRVKAYEEIYRKRNLSFIIGDLRDSNFTDDLIRRYTPHTIYNLAQQRSAPYSMIDLKHALYTQVSNITINLNVIFAVKRHSPKTHIIKMGTMGEYGTPNFRIEEGWMNIEYRKRKDRIPVPRAGNSWYHLSKVFDSYNIMFANAIWGIRATDIMQGVVYGSRIEELSQSDERMNTFLAFDGVWGTVINKYIAQMLSLKKLLIYGKGMMTRGFLSLQDSIDCLTLLGDRPAELGEYRVVNQLDEIYNTLQLAHKVRKAGKEFGYDPEYVYIDDPRIEKQEHYYNVSHRILRSLGFRPKFKMSQVIRQIIEDMAKHVEILKEHQNIVWPNVLWKNENNLHNGEKIKEEPLAATELWAPIIKDDLIQQPKYIRA